VTHRIALPPVLVEWACQRGVAISTASWTEPAHRLYSRIGFERAPERDHEPAPGVHLWAYVLPLCDPNEAGAR
jgi:hypothetical protein